MKNACILLAILVAAAPADAQTHPCDLAPTTVSVTGNAPLQLLFCARPADDLVRVDVTVDNSTAPFVDLTATAMTAPSATGYVQYRAPLGTLPVGSHTVRVQAVNLTLEGVEQLSDLSDPLSFTVAAPKPRPGKPKVTGVVR